ncbi:MAG: hypothetical protein HY819_07120 [Acidobacteria bacterium]|nr:hypothetical protein [Acidobacteriota bacterium]
MTKILISWIGMTDLKAAKGVESVGIGPIAQAVIGHFFDKIVLISNYSEAENNAYISWLKTKTNIKIEHYSEQLTDPTDYEQIYFIDIKVVTDVLAKNGSNVSLTFHISPGTPAMQVIWVILAKTRFEAELIESSKEQGVKTPYIPFEISAEFIPKLLQTV